MRIWLLTSLDLDAIEKLSNHFEIVDDSSNTKTLFRFQDPDLFWRQVQQDKITGIICPTNIQILEFFKNFYQSDSLFLKFVVLIGKTDERWNWNVFTDLPFKIIYPAEIYGKAQAEYILGAIITFYRQIHLADLELRTDESQGIEDWEYRFQGELLSSKAIGFLGWDHTSQILANILKNSFNCSIYIWNKQQTNLNNKLPSYAKIVKDREEIFKIVDIISIHFLPINTHPISLHELQLLKRNVLLINITSALAIEEQDIIEFLQEDNLTGVILDLYGIGPVSYTEKLFKFSKVLLTPRIAANISQVDISKFVVKMILKWLKKNVL